jgi:hypothetical protein
MTMTSSKDTNLPFSDEELTVFCDTELIDTKTRIMGKSESGLKELAGRLKEWSEGWNIDKKFLENPGKISRGENHRGYPYMVLDYPRNFALYSGVSLRTLIWWGHYIKITLHAHGTGNEWLIEHLVKNHDRIKKNNFMILTSPDIWSNRIGDYTEIPIIDTEFSDAIKEQLKINGTLRLSQFHSLTEMNRLVQIVKSASTTLFT